jgi:hypothetical protein
MGNGQPTLEKKLSFCEDDVMSNAVVDLGFANIDQKKVAALAEALGGNTVVKKLCLGWNGIGDSGAQRLAESLEKNKTLTELNLTENGIGERGAQRLADALQVNTTLRVLDLMSNRIGDNGAGYLASALGKNKTLQELRLYDTGIEYSGASRLMTAAERNETLLVLDIRWNDISDRRLVSRMEQSFARNRGAASRAKNVPMAQRGDLELYIVSMRDKISSNGEFGPYLNDSERETLQQDLAGAEAWLQDNRNASLEEYRTKLDELKVSGDVVAMRYKEAIMRDQMVTAIYSTIANYRATVESPEDRSGDMVPEKEKQILDACKELEEWLTQMKAAQEHLPSYERPVLRCSDMVDRNLELANMVAELLEDSHGGHADALKEVAASSARGAASARGQQAAAAGQQMAGGSERRAQLVAYINQLQDKIAVTGEYGAYVSDAERERLSAHLVGAAVWASQTTGIPTVHYIEKLQELRSVGDVIEWRCDEDSMRTDWVAAVTSTIANCRNAATNPGDRYEHVTPEKLEKIQCACRELEEWLRTMDVAQKKLAKYERPVLLCADMERRNLELAKMVGELLEESSRESQSGRQRPRSPDPIDNGRALPPPPHLDYEEAMPPPMSPQGNDEGPRRNFSPPPRSGPPSARRGNKAPQESLQPAPPRAPPEPGGGLRDAGAKTEEERLLELEALDAACAQIMDEDDAPPMAGRLLSR